MAIADLTDEKTVAPLLAKFRDGNPNLVAASAAAGAGSRPGGAAASPTVKEVSQRELMAMASADPQKHAAIIKTLWADHAAGKVKIVA
jgi:hypothetical protein